MLNRSFQSYFLQYSTHVKRLKKSKQRRYTLGSHLFAVLLRFRDITVQIQFSVLLNLFQGGVKTSFFLITANKILMAKNGYQVATNNLNSQL